MQLAFWSWADHPETATIVHCTKVQLLSLPAVHQENSMASTKSVPAEWNRRRTRYDPPGLEEAITAAQGLTDQIESQIEIAAQLIGLPEDDVRPQVLAMKARHTHKGAAPVQGHRGRTVVVERRGARMAR
jgi:hypothetical protein